MFLQSIREIDVIMKTNLKDMLIIWLIQTKRAVERNIEIIGEAVSRILKKDKNLSWRMLKKLSEQEIELFTVMIRYRMNSFGVFD